MHQEMTSALQQTHTLHST